MNPAVPNLVEIDEFLTAAAWGGYDVLQRHINTYGAEIINKKAQNGNTALILAAFNGYEEYVQVLLDAGADKHLQGEEGDTALIWAATNGHTACVKALLEAGAEYEQTTHLGNTPLMRATFNGRLDCMRLLLDAGADPLIKNLKGKTALDMAVSAENDEAIEILIDAIKNHPDISLGVQVKSFAKGIDKPLEVKSNKLVLQPRKPST